MSKESIEAMQARLDEIHARAIEHMKSVNPNFDAEKAIRFRKRLKELAKAKREGEP